MPDTSGKIYKFDSFTLDPAQGVLFRLGDPVRIPPKTLELLLYFVQHNNEVLDKESLMRVLWPDTFVEDANLTVHISNLRRALSGSSANIETFPKRGYRFVADVSSGPFREKDDNESSDDPLTGRQASSDEHLKRLPAFTAGTARGSERAAATVSTGGRRVLWFTFISFVLVAAAGYTIWRWEFRRSGDLAIVAIAGTEQSSSLAISSNGEYLAHAVSKAGKRTLMMTHIASGSSVQLAPPDEDLFWGMTFSPDDRLLYFVKEVGDDKVLFNIPFLGGPVTKVLNNVGSTISFSPDGREFCFVRNTSENETTIIIANKDGTGERALASRKAPDYFDGSSITWSPDGRLIADIVGRASQVPSVRIVGIDATTGEENPLSDSTWVGSDGLQWVKDGSGLVAGLFDEPEAPTQVWFIPFPKGKPSRITNGIENLAVLGISVEGETILADQFRDESNLWIVSPKTAAEAMPVSGEKRHIFKWVRWTPDGRLLFGSNSEGHRDIWIMNADGSGQQKLTSGEQAGVMPIESPDGRYIVFSSARSEGGVFNLWRMNTDGGGLRQLTDGSGEIQPAITPDGQWVFFASGNVGSPPIRRRIFKVPAEGGEAVQFTDAPAYAPDISPDGKFVACWYKANENRDWMVAIIPVEGGPPVRLLDLPQSNTIQWTPDGKGISFIKTDNAVSNIWVQSLDGGPAVPVTKFTSELIINFDWSGDGRLVCSRTHKSRDAVLIRNFR